MPIPSLIPVPVFRRGSSSLSLVPRSRPGQTFLIKVRDGIIGHYQQFLVGDILRAKVWNGSSLIDNWLRVDVVSDPGAASGYFGYTCTRMSGTAGLIPAGTAIVDYGQSGASFISLSSDGAIGAAPNITIGKHSGAPWSSTTTLVKLGNLNGDYGISSNLYGFGVGDYSGGNYLRYDPTNGFVLKASGGSVTVDGSGIRISAPSVSNFTKSYGFTDASDSDSQLGAWDAYASSSKRVMDFSVFSKTGKTSSINIVSTAGSAQQSQVSITANDADGVGGAGVTFTFNAPTATVGITGTTSITSGLNIGTSTGAATGSIKASNQIQSEVATGTAPLIVASTTAVSNLNADMVDGLHAAGLGQQDIGARVYHNTTQSITNNTWLTLAFNSERWDTDTIHDTATNNSRLTCKTAGKYVITGHVEMASNVAPLRLRIMLNGTTYIAYMEAPGNVTLQSIATIYDLGVNDYVELLCYQNSAGAVNVTSAGNYSPEFAMQKIA